MSRSVCPWCQNPYVENEDGVLVCKNTDCRACAEEFLHKELDRTRKVLDVAVDALNYLRRTNPICYQMECIEKALGQINEHFADASKKITKKD